MEANAIMTHNITQTNYCVVSVNLYMVNLNPNIKNIKFHFQRPKILIW